MLAIVISTHLSKENTSLKEEQKFFSIHYTPKSPVDVAREEYVRKHNLNAILAYGKALDTALINTDSIRANLEEEFYIQLAKEAGDSVGVPWNILYGLWMRESSMNPTAKGDGNTDTTGHVIPGTFRAFGIGQMHLPTARDNDPKITVAQLLDPIEGGYASAQYLKKCLSKFNGKTRYGISAYQQGPGKTQSQFIQRILPSNIGYVMDVFQFASDAAIHASIHDNKRTR